MIDELSRVILTADLPAQGLHAGDIGAVVLVHQQGAGYTVEFQTLDGETVAVVTVAADGVRPVRPNEIAHVRALAVV